MAKRNQRVKGNPQKLSLCKVLMNKRQITKEKKKKETLTINKYLVDMVLQKNIREIKE